jgi:hypothetical protein
MNFDILEEIAQEICDEFEAFAPPIPVELMLQQPPENMWDEIDVAQLSGSFLSIKERYSPRMSLARLLVRHIAASEWGISRGLDKILGDSELLNAFARMLLMPKEMILGLTTTMKTPQAISLRFEVPESDAKDRLIELA